LQAELAEKLPHIESLCVHEMVMRAFKHVLQAVIAASKATSDLPVNIAAALNVMLGTSPEGDIPLIWRWVDTFVRKRFGWKLIGKVAQNELCKYSILRGLCHKVKFLKYSFSVFLCSSEYEEISFAHCPGLEFFYIIQCRMFGIFTKACTPSLVFRLELSLLLEAITFI
jgi:hypothetical protein